MSDLTEQQGAAADLGHTITQARSKLGMSVDAVATATRMRKSYVMAIESGDLAQLPGEPYTRAYIRRYAEFLGLDMDAIIAEYTSSNTLPPRKLFVIPEIFSAQTHAQGRLALASSIAVLLVVGLWNLLPPTIIAAQVMPLTELEATAPTATLHRCRNAQPTYPPCRWENTDLWYMPTQPKHHLFAPDDHTTPQNPRRSY